MVRSHFPPGQSMLYERISNSQKRVKIIKKNVDLLKKVLKLFHGLGNYFSS